MLLWAGLVLLFAGLVPLLLALFGSTGTPRRPVTTVQDRIALYTLATPAPAAVVSAGPVAEPVRPGLTRSAAGQVGRLIRGRSLEATLSGRLDQAAVSMTPGEWLLLHGGSVLAAGVLLGLLGGGSASAAVLGVILGTAVPLVVLRVRTQRRKAAFDAQLADSLQLLAGSLRAGYSVPQAIDAIVREGEEPMTTEFGRALVEARLGVQLEDALESVGRRMDSVDFGWVVMAMRIQRDVGGNLAEVLTNVAATLRERERLRRQVRVLSAEGRLSAWILGLLPVVFGGYLLLVRPQYLQPLWTTTLGWLMLLTGALLFVAGVVWLRRVVRVVV
jgi:tight adherence protein B